jgi:DNA repair exonuclease SbcCD ATPase subunit
MPQMRDIFKDGLEYFQRRFRWMLLRARLSDERRKYEKHLRRLGRKAWEMGAPTCQSVPIGSGLRALQDQIDELNKRARASDDKLEAGIRGVEVKLHEEDEQRHDTRARLDGALLQRARRVKSIAEIEGELRSLSSRRERLKDDLEFCHKRRQELANGGSRNTNGGGSPGDLAATGEALGAHLEETAAVIKSMQSRLSYNRRAMPSLDSSIAEIRLEMQQCDSRRRELEEQLGGLRAELRTLLVEADRELAPLLKLRNEKYFELGRELLHNRSDETELRPLFSSADLAVFTIESLEKEAASEKKLLSLLDQNAVAAFVGITIGCGVLLLAVIILLITLAIVL